jgi:hypothetical protein
MIRDFFANSSPRAANSPVFLRFSEFCAICSRPDEDQKLPRLSLVRKGAAVDLWQVCEA